MRFSRLIGSVLLFAALVIVAGAQEQKAVPNSMVSALDKSADPCVDFYQFVCGGWVKNNPIPSDQAIWSRFGELAERNLAELRGILENAAKASNRTPDEQKIGDYYASCMDEAAIEKKGTAVLKPIFDRIDSLQEKSSLPVLIAYIHSHGITPLFSFGSGPDF